MNTMKKILALLMAFVLAFSLGITAFASDDPLDPPPADPVDPPAASPGSIKIIDVAPGSKYDLYLVFPATVENGKVAYQNTGDDFKDAIAAAMGSDAAVNFYEDGSNIIPNAGFSAANFAEWLLDNLPNAADDTATADANGVAVFEDLAQGYYLVVPQGDDQQASLATVIDGRITQVQNKNDMPLDKDVYDSTGADINNEGVNVGDELSYEITGKVPVITGNNYDYTYIVTDKMTEGLTFGNEVTITIGEGTGAISLTLNADGTIAAAANNTAEIWGVPFEIVPTANNMPLTGNKIRFGHADTENGGTFTFELSLDVANDVLRQHGGEKVTIAYTGTVNEEAGSELLQNTAVLTYGDSADLKYKDAETDNYICRIVIDKFETGNRSQKLPGAKFKLYRLKDDTITGDSLHAESNREYYNLDSTTGIVSWTGTGTEIETDENGYAEFPHLEDGTYYLIETQAPVDYTVLQGYIEVVVDGSASTDTRLTNQQRVDALTTTVNVANKPGTSMPSTGGVGATLLTIGGVVLMLAAGAYLVLRKRQEN